MTRRFFAAAVAVVALAAPSFACDYVSRPVAKAPEFKRVIAWETVTTWETRREAFTADFNVTDDCGREFVVTRTGFRNVRVPVTKRVAVTKLIKVAE